MNAKANVCTSTHAGWELAVLTSAAVILVRQACGRPACDALFESLAGALGDRGQAEPGAGW